MAVVDTAHQQLPVNQAMGCLQPETEATQEQPGHAQLCVHSAQHNGVGEEDRRWTCCPGAQSIPGLARHSEVYLTHESCGL